MGRGLQPSHSWWHAGELRHPSEVRRALLHLSNHQNAFQLAWEVSTLLVIPEVWQSSHLS